MKNFGKKRVESYEDLKAELQHYKETIDIRDYILSVGYKVDKSRDTKNYRAFVNENTGDKLYVPMKDKYPVAAFFVNQYDKEDSGSIVDFIRTREGKNIHEVRQTLQAFRPGSYIAAPREEKEQAGEQADQQLKRQRYIISKIVAQKQLLDDYYLKARFLEEGIIHDKAFRGKIFTNEAPDGRFTSFPIAVPGEKEVKGLAMKAHAQERFIGERVGIWASHPTLNRKAALDKMIIAEHPIDAMSYFQLNREKLKSENTVFVSTAGNPSRKQIEALKNYLFQENPKAVVLANDNDTAGRNYNRMYTQLVEELNQEGKLKHPISILEHYSTFKDFNADVKARKLLEFRLLEQLDIIKPKDFEQLKPMSQELIRLIEEKKYKEISRPEHLKALRTSYIEKEVDGTTYAFSMRDVAVINNNKKLLSLVDYGLLGEKEKSGLAMEEQPSYGEIRSAMVLPDPAVTKKTETAVYEAMQLMNGKSTGEMGEPAKDRKEQLTAAEKSIHRAGELKEKVKSNAAVQEPAVPLEKQRQFNVKEPTVAAMVTLEEETKAMKQPQTVIKHGESLDLESVYFAAIDHLQQQIRGKKEYVQEWEKLQLYKKFPHLSDQDVETYVQLQLNRQQGHTHQLELNRFRHKGANEIGKD